MVSGAAVPRRPLIKQGLGWAADCVVVLANSLCAPPALHSCAGAIGYCAWACKLGALKCTNTLLAYNHHGTAAASPLAPSHFCPLLSPLATPGRWRQHYASIRECGEAAKQARAEAQEALGAGAPQIASTTALSALLRGFRAFDKDRSGRVQSGEFAAVLSHAGLGLSSDEVSQLAEGGSGPLIPWELGWHVD